MHDFQRTYMDLNQEESMNSNDSIKGLVAAVVLFAMYVAVSTMDYQDCIRGAVSC
jgi:hypothetical protein